MPDRSTDDVLDCENGYSGRLEKSREERLAERLHAAGYQVAKRPLSEYCLTQISESVSLIERNLR